jgi:peptidoglycan/xylan/chitin deacetylase (PgdA/CDA1 family)/uncharacterized caspase-like protein
MLFGWQPSRSDMRREMIKHAALSLSMLALCAGMQACQQKDQVSAAPPASKPSAVPEREPAEIVAAFRRIIVLVDDEATLDATAKERVPVIGKMIFQQNHERLDALGEQLLAEIQAPGEPARLIRFLTDIESNPEYRDADKLAFIDVFDDIADALRRPGIAEPRAKLLPRVEEDIKALREILKLYDKELEKIFARIETRGMPVRREAWSSYVAYLKSKYSAQAILKDYENAIPAAGTRGAAKRDPKLEVFGTELPPKTVVLTFDDGPHARHTDRILAILKQYKVASAVFFEVGKNLGSIQADGSIRLGKGAAASKRMVEAGHIAANHSFSHAVLTKLDEKGYTSEIEDTSRLLQEVSAKPPSMFRAPYGERNNAIIDLVMLDQMKSVMWNVDSLDWADPVPASIANRVLEVLRKEGRGIILFHDIHSRTVEALPLLLETLQAEGYRFASWNGERFAVAASRADAPAEARPEPAAAQAPPAIYRESWAVVIGIDDYAHWPKLRYAVNDANGMRDLLINRFRFKPENIFSLSNQDATREHILSLLGDKLANPELVKRDDRVFVFYAGHGTTRKLPSGRDLGYIVPVDADVSNFQGQSISMTNFQDIAEAIPSKHLFFVMDSCYSGLGLTRGGGSQNYLKEMTRRTARQMFTAGGADQEVADGGPNGHSIFTWTLMQALEGKGDLNADGYITASELASYVGPVVSSLSRQTPAYGNLPGSEGGEFVFELKHENEFLSEASPQLSDAAIKLNGEVDKLRDENVKLQKQLADAQASLQKLEGVAKPPAAEKRQTALSGNDRGIAYFKEKRYQEALDEFVAAARIEPANAQIANNAGFASFRLGKISEAEQWYGKTIELDPKRAVAYLNLGDAYYQTDKKADAAKAYEKFLALQPGATRAAELRQRIAASR